MASQYTLFILDCWAEWCGPCRTIGPVIEELAVETKGKAVFGKLIDKLVGAYPKPALVAKLQRYL